MKREREHTQVSEDQPLESDQVVRVVAETQAARKLTSQTVGVRARQWYWEGEGEVYGMGGEAGPEGRGRIARVRT